MLKKPLLIAFVVLAIAFSATAKQPEFFKNLAGTPIEMDSMRLPDVRSTGIKSKSAMLPIRFKDGRATLDIPIETTENLRLSLLAPNSRGWEIIASNGTNKDLDLRSNSELFDREFGEIGLDGVRFPAEVFEFNYVKAGIWRIELSAPKAANFRDDETVGYLVVTSQSPYRVYSYIDTHQTLVGRNIGVSASVFDYSKDGEAAIPGSIDGLIRKIEGEIILPNGSSQKMRFDENGQSNFVPTIPGEYRLHIKVEARTPEGESFVRTSEQVVQILSDNVRFGKSTYTNLLDDERLQVNLPAEGLKTGRKVIFYGEVWARNENGERPVAWLGGMSVAEGRGFRTNLPVTFDGRWLANADASDTFELRNVRIQDADYFVTLAQAGKIELSITSVPENARSFNGVITDEMRMGKRPAMPAVNDAAGGKLMLVHGYCSGGNTFPTSQFSNFIVFNDPNKNRTHDQFANLIRNFGASYPSFGIVAHSQGGASSLHLYTYYWSGLDYAGAGRLIQSVGTPYQGTALAGNLAALGSVFGAGCGTNYDLTYSGASAWLSGIPSWARAKVHFYTTSFKDVWWRYDYCNIATDLFLSDPDDGVIEKSKGQLSGATNRGHKTGWCHTSGMRDPAQTSDSSRNAEMNANAAR